MKIMKLVITTLIVMLIFSLTACNKTDSIICDNCSTYNLKESNYCANCGTAFFQDNTTTSALTTSKTNIENIKITLGEYHTINNDASFTIYATNDYGEIFFSADWYRLNGFGGVATFNNEEYIFSISNGGEIIDGSFSFDNNTIQLTVDRIDIPYIENGKYSFVFYGETPKETTYCGFGELKHDAFINFINEYCVIHDSWDYYGTVGDIFKKPNDEYTDIFDLYSITTNEKNTYFVICPSDDYNTYEIYQVGYAGALKKTTNFSEETTDTTENLTVNTDISADTWYYLTSNKVILFQNAKVKNSTIISQGAAFMVTYYPICVNCHVQGNTIRMKSVSVDTPISDMHRCQNCNTTTYVRFKIEY